ncbi:hypothetical protein Z043_121696, partial [Scleropages formosus]
MTRAMWNDVELLANDDTSTVRVSFDLRRECGSALYQVDNLVKLSCSEKVLHNPDLYASYASNYIVVVADRTVVLFDYNFQSVLLHLNFGKLLGVRLFLICVSIDYKRFLYAVIAGSDVDTVAVCHRGQFLLVGERNGNLHLVYMRSLVVYSLPSMTALYSLEVSSTSALVKMGVNMSRGPSVFCCGEVLHRGLAREQSLRQLLDLFNKYHCKLSLSDFEKRNTRSIVFLMLDKVLAPELIPSVIESSVRPYTQEHRLHLDELLLHYIRDMLERCSSQTTSLFTEWEAKAMAVLDCMTDSDLVEDAVLEIMYKAVVPWSSVVEQLVQKHLEMDHPRQELLKESYQLMEIKKLLRVYGIRNFNPSSDNLAMVLVRRILKQDLPSSLEDALKVAQVYKLDTSQIYFLYIIQLISQAKRELCVTVLKELPPAEAECVTERLATWARLELQNKHLISEEHKKHHIDVAQVMVESLKFLQRIQQDNAFKRIECVNNLKMFEAIANLQEDFDIFLSPEEYADRALRAHELYQHHYDACTGRVLFHAAKMLCQMLEDNVPMIIPDGINLPAIIHNLACQAITVCHPDLLLDCVELCKSTRAAMDVYQQCQIDDDGFTAK